MNEVDSILHSIQRQQSPRLLAVLVRVFGAHNLDMAEDVLQEAFCKALIDWRQNGVPDNPPAWLITTAKRQALDRIRQTRTRLKYAEDLSFALQSDWTAGSTLDKQFSEDRIKDDQLRMLFMCCHEQVSAHNRLPFMLKHLCGLSIAAIASALLIPDATVKKRLLRTKQKFKNYQFSIPDESALPLALNTVHTALYLLFNEGFHSTSNNTRLDLMLCKDAMGLTNLLVDESNIANQDTFGLLALMHFHMARAAAKVDKQGQNIPIDMQDRSLWERDTILVGCALLDYARQTNRLGTGRYFIEANIAQQHCLSLEFESTQWQRILDLYHQLYAVTRSPVTQLNLAVAMAYCGKVTQAIELVQSLLSQPVFRQSHLPLATLAHLHALKGETDLALNYAQQSTQIGGSEHENKLMLSQVEKLLNKDQKRVTCGKNPL